MKKVQKLLISALCVAMGAGALMACGDDAGTGSGKYTVTFYDGTTVLYTQEVSKNGTVTRPAEDPPKEGYEFVRWCATPTYSQPFDFSVGIVANTSVYAGFRSTAADDHTWYLAGTSSTSALFAESGDWKEFKGDSAADLPASVTFDHDANKGNRFTFTADFYAKDKFQILNTVDGWGNYQIGYGYMTPEQYSTESDAPFYFGGGLSGINKTADIMVGQSGNYTLTLDVDVDGKLTELSYKRNGDAAEVSSDYTHYFIKGENITAWADMYNDATQMRQNGDIYTLEIYLKQNEQFMFISKQSVDGQIASGPNIKADKLTEASKAYVDGTTGNITAKASGMYTFVYDAKAETLSVTFNDQKTPAQYDYYLDGKYGEVNWGAYQQDADSFKLTANNGVYTYTGLSLAADDEIVIRAYAAGTEELGWDNMANTYSYKYFNNTSDAFVAANPAGDNYNIKVVTAGTYDIAFDSYSKIIKITIHSDSPDIYDIYIKGVGITNSAGTPSPSDWNHGFAEEWRMVLNSEETAYEITVTITAGEGNSFGLALYDKGASSGNGTFIDVTKLGTDGDANDSFRPESGTNFTCTTTGTYKVVYTIATGKVDIYSVSV
ncbi:MAG: InlB B-repeat-containing protein [Clostridiales bacterium]|nr:InlB B-repeat-containing protein [Clostridiales bacterium]